MYSTLTAQNSFFKNFHYVEEIRKSLRTRNMWIDYRYLLVQVILKFPAHDCFAEFFSSSSDNYLRRESRRRRNNTLSYGRASCEWILAPREKKEENAYIAGHRVFADEFISANLNISYHQVVTLILLRFATFLQWNIVNWTLTASTSSRLICLSSSSGKRATLCAKTTWYWLPGWVVPPGNVTFRQV